VLDFTSAVLRQRLPHHPVVRPHHLEGVHIAEAVGYACRVNDVCEHDGTKRTAQRGLAMLVVRCRVSNAPQECFNG